MAGWTAVNHGAQADEDRHFTIEEDQAYAIHIETGVYMTDAKAGSWSGKLPHNQQSSDEEIEGFIDGMKHLRRAQEATTAGPRAAEQRASDVQQAAGILMEMTDDPASEDGEEDDTQRQLREREQDEKVREFITDIKIALKQGCVLTLQHTGAHDVNEDMRCMHPYCTSRDGCITVHSYYVTIAKPDTATYICRCCLTCFEAMWSGKLQIGELSDPGVKIDAVGQQEAHISSMQESVGQAYYGRCMDSNESYGLILTILAGTNYEMDPQRRDSAQPQPDIPASLLSSKHAPGPDEIAASQAYRRPQIQAQPGALPAFSSSAVGSGASTQSSSSINNFQGISFDVTRFQHLAHLIQPGDGLNDVEKAVLAVWKVATKQQFGWTGTSLFSAPPSEEKVAVGGGEGLDVGRVEEMVGLSRVQCFGKDLSEALERVATGPDL